ncbi:MAG: DUF2726 domain-containing protein [Rubripirellula sp.]
MKMVGGETEETIPQSLRFELRNQFLEQPESDLFHHLCEALGDRVIVCPKVRAADVIYMPNAAEQIDQAVRIDRKFIDYLVCDRVTRRPVCAIQLDRAPQGSKSPVYDQFLEGALKTAGLSVLHLRTDRAPSQQMIRERISPLLEKRSIRRVDSAGS